MNARSNWQPGPTRGTHRWDFERLDGGDQHDREMLAQQRLNARKHSTPALPPTAEKIGDPGALLFFVGAFLGLPAGAAALFMFQLIPAVF